MYFGALKNAEYIQLNTPTDKVHILLIFQSVLQKEKFDNKKKQKKSHCFKELHKTGFSTQSR